MLGIERNGEQLDLVPGTVLEMELENPFLEFTGVDAKQYSMPISIRATDKNLRLTDFWALPQTRVDYKGIDVKVSDDNEQHSIGKLKLEKSRHHLNRPESGTISMYYLTGVSALLQDIKNVNLRDADYGGVRSFPWLGFDENGSGFWAHITRIMRGAPNTADYAFFPVINKSFSSVIKAQSVNQVARENGQPAFQKRIGGYGNVFCPFPYLHYVIKRAMAHVGWRVEGAILNDPDFQKIVMVNFVGIMWCASDTFWGLFPIQPNIKFNLKDHLPDMKITDFLIALKNRFGWWFDFDRRNKVLRIKEMKTTATGVVKDLTKYADPQLDRNQLSEKRIYSIKNTFVGGQQQPSFLNMTYKGWVMEEMYLPAPTDDQYGHYYLVARENRFYVLRLNDQNQLEWQVYDDNIYDYLPAGATQEITTAATTLGMDRLDTYVDWAPRFDIAGFNPDIFPQTTSEGEPWGIHLVFHHGMQPNKNGHLYPYGSNYIYSSSGQQIGNWALTFECRTILGVDVGLYERQWKPVLSKFTTSEDFEIVLNLPRHLYLQLQFSDVIAIDGVRLYIKKMKTTVPYTDKVTLECSRI